MLQQFIKALKNIPHLAWIFFLFLIFLLLNIKDLTLALQPDEVYSLTNFVFVPWSVVLTDYDVPNNHILFNTINKFYLSLCHINNLEDAIGSPGIVRSINIAYILFSIGFLYHFGRIFHGRLAAIFSVLFLICTPAYINVALIARGYMLSITLLSALLFFTALVFYSKQYWYSIVVIICTAHLGFTNPTNYLYVGSMMAFITLAAALVGRFDKAYFLSLVAMVVGILFSFILYSSVFWQVFDGSYELVIPNRYKNTFVIMCEALPHILTTCYFMVPLLFLPILLAKEKKNYLKKITVLLLFFAAPFIINISLKHAVPPRAFAPSAISIAVLFGFSMAESIQRATQKWGKGV